MWHLISTAPFDCDLELALIDATVHPFSLPAYSWRLDQSGNENTH
jgi:hypothetical protein